MILHFNFLYSNNMVHSAGVEPTTKGLGNLCSVHLSYECIIPEIKLLILYSSIFLQLF